MYRILSVPVYMVLISIFFSEATIICPPHPLVPNGFLIYSQANKLVLNQYQTLITLKCAPGFFPTISDGIVRCSSDGSWVGSLGKCVRNNTINKPCQAVNPVIPHVIYQPKATTLNQKTYPHGTKARLNCPLSATLGNNKWIVCKNGIWNGSLGTC
ncbi:unnamed protein product [Thelazia callipaeda]|uniref:Sushi domain-containing protein n=1 Tax=Thelazia callipaeda TaxID=103827 RepID=A0A0N5D024_THECL|nr:unnamed protein product [Thelazia callipaeda]